MAGAIVQQPPKEREKTGGDKNTIPLKKFTFFDRKLEKSYNYIVKVQYIVDLADFLFAVSPRMATKSSKEHNTFFLDGFTSCGMGIIADGGEAR